jgi:hypothetical protein
MAANDKKPVMEQIRALKEQEAKLIDGAKAEAIGKAKEAIGELKELGFHYRLAEGEGERVQSPKGRQIRGGKAAAKGRTLSNLRFQDVAPS